MTLKVEEFQDFLRGNATIFLLPRDLYGPNLKKHLKKSLYEIFGPEKDLCFLTAENIPRPHTKPQV